MIKRYYRGISCLLVFVMIFTIVSPVFGQYPASAADSNRTSPEDVFSLEAFKKLVFNDPNLVAEVSTFEQQALTQGSTYEVIAEADPWQGGSVTVSNGNPTHGETVMVEAVSNYGYRFDHWFERHIGAIISYDASYEFTATRDFAFIAYFVPQFGVEFESSQYYAVRADDYVLIPLSLVNRDPDKEIRYSTSDGTAGAWIDYQPVTGELLNLDPSFALGPGNEETVYIPIRLLLSGEEWDEAKSLVLTLHDPGEGVDLGETYQAVLTLLPHQDYTEEPDFAFLYNGYDFENTGADNWWLDWGGYDNPPYEKTYDTYKTLVIPTGVYHGDEYLQGKVTGHYLLDGLDFGWRQVYEGKTYAVILEGPYMGDESSIVAKMENSAPTPTDPLWAGTGLSLDDKQPLKGKYVGFYADEGAEMEVLYVEMQKKQFNIRVHLPGGSTLEAAGTSYENAFNGRFTYDSPDSLKAIPPYGYNFSHWAAFYYTDEGRLFLVDDDYGYRFFQDDEIAIDALINRMVEWADYYSEELQYNLAGPHWVQLRPVFKSKPYYRIWAGTEYPEMGEVTVSNGNPMEGETVVVEALANEGYSFHSWRDGYAIVSTDAYYEFIATQDRSLYAIFVPTIFAEFEYLGFNAVRAEGYVLIPVVFKTMAGALWFDDEFGYYYGLELGAEVGYSISGGTAEEGVDFEAVSGTLFLDYYNPREPYYNVRYIPVKLMDSGQEGEKTLILTLHDPGSGTGLGEYGQAELTIGPDYQYAAPSSTKYLYNGYDPDDTGAGNWNPTAERTHDGFKTLFAVCDFFSPSKLIQTKEKHLLFGELLFELKTQGDYMKSRAYTAYESSYALASRTISGTTPYQTYSLFIGPGWQHRGMYVGFYNYLDGGLNLYSGSADIRSVRITKGQYDVRVDLPGYKTKLVVEGPEELEGLEYEKSFSGRFDYDGEEILKLINKGYDFLGWMYSYVDYFSGTVGYGYINDYGSANLKIADMVKQTGLLDKHNLSIHLRPLLLPQLNEIFINPENDEGSATGSGYYWTGEEVTLTSQANEGYGFCCWEIIQPSNFPLPNTKVDLDPWVFIASEDLYIEARFKPLRHVTVEVKPTYGGDAAVYFYRRDEKILSDGTVMEGLTASVEATAADGYRFDKWTENGEPVEGNPGAVYEFIATVDRHLVANFVPRPFEITAKALPSQAGNVTGGGPYYFGSEITLEAEALGYYEFVNWQKNGEEVSREPVFTFTLEESHDLTFTAVFRLQPGRFAISHPRQFTGMPVYFDASMIFEGDAGEAFTWQFGDGTGASGMEVSHAYAQTGTYSVTLDALRNDGKLVRKTQEVTIVDPDPLEDSIFAVTPMGTRQVPPGGKMQWTVDFRNNGVAMANKDVIVSWIGPDGENTGDLGSGMIINTGLYGSATYEVSVPESMTTFGLYTVTFSHGPFTVARSLQVYSTSIVLSGRVYDSYNGRYLTGARVTAGGKAAHTDARGEYTIAGLSSQEACDYTISLTGYEIDFGKLNLVSAQSVHNFPLVRMLPEGDPPLIVKITSEFSNSLNNVDAFISYGKNRLIKFNAMLKWGGHDPGIVYFWLPKHPEPVPGTLQPDGFTYSLTVDIDKDMGPGGRLKVQAVSDHGIESGEVDAMFEVMPPSPYADGDLEMPVIPPVSVGDSSFPFVGGDSFSLDFTSVQTEVVFGTDGTASLFIGYAVKKKDAKPGDLTNPVKFQEAKKLYNDLQKKKSMAKTKVEYDIIIGGKIVMAYDQDFKDWKFKEGWIMMSGSADVSYTSYYMTPIFIPVYVQCKFGGSLTVMIGVTYAEYLDWQAGLSMEMYMRLAAGVGLAGLVSAEIFGKLSSGFTVSLTQGEFESVWIKVTGGVKMVFFFYSKTYSESKTWHLIEGAEAPQLVMSMSDIGEMEYLSRDYLNHPSVWLPDEPRVMLTGDGTADHLSVTTLQSNVLGYSEPRLILTAEGPMLVWVADADSLAGAGPITARSFGNHTQAQFSLFDGTTWSAPRAIHDDGTADFYPQAAPAVNWTGNRTAAVAWLNMAREFVDAPELDELLSEGRVAVAFYDPSAGSGGSWNGYREFDPGSFQDTSPQVSAADDSALVVWTRSVPSPATQSEGDDFYNDFNALYPQQSDLMFSRWNGSAWSEPGTAVAGAGSVIKSSLAFDGTNALLAYIVDEDGSLETEDDQELYYTTFTGGNWSLPVRVTHNAIKDTNPQAVYLEGEPLLFWYQDGQVFYLRGLHANPAVAVVGKSDGLTDFTLATGEDQSSLALVWGDGVDDYTQEIFAAVYDPVFDSWSYPIQLTHNGMVNRSIDAVLDEEGNLLAVYNRVQVHKPQEDEDMNDLVTESVDLVFSKLALGRDLAVEEVTLSEENPVPGSQVTISALVANRGEWAEENVEVAFYEGDPHGGGRQIGETQILDGVMDGGERRTASIQWTIPQSLEVRDLYVLVDPANKVADRNRANNKGFISAAMADLQITEVRSQLVGFDEFLITATVVNRGLVTAENAVVSISKTQFHQFVTSGYSFLENGRLGNISPGQQKEVTLSWRYQEDDFEEDGTVFLSLEATSDTRNVLGGANTARVLVRKPETSDEQVQEFALAPNSVTLPVGAEIQLQGIFNPPDAKDRRIDWESSNNAVASVDAGGKVYALAKGTATITATTKDGGFKDKCIVTVVDRASRFAGIDRFTTAVNISREGWPDEADTVVLARGDDYADALAGVPLAFHLDAPILLTHTNRLNDATREEIERLNARRVIILGGTGAISQVVERSLVDEMGLVVERIAGDDRYATAVQIANKLRDEGAIFDTAFIAVGTNFADALSASSYAAMQGRPILLTRADRLPNYTDAALKNLEITRTILCGGVQAVSEAVFDLLPNPIRISGADRYATAVALAEEFMPLSTQGVGIATGLNFPDAIAGGVLAAKRNTAVLLVRGDLREPAPVVQKFLESRQISSFSLFGGTSAISSEMEEWFN